MLLRFILECGGLSPLLRRKELEIRQPARQASPGAIGRCCQTCAKVAASGRTPRGICCLLKRDFVLSQRLALGYQLDGFFCTSNAAE